MFLGELHQMLAAFLQQAAVRGARNGFGHDVRVDDHPIWLATIILIGRSQLS